MGDRTILQTKEIINHSGEVAATVEAFVSEYGKEFHYQVNVVEANGDFSLNACTDLDEALLSFQIEVNRMLEKYCKTKWQREQEEISNEHVDVVNNGIGLVYRYLERSMPTEARICLRQASAYFKAHRVAILSPKYNQLRDELETLWRDINNDYPKPPYEGE